MPTYEYTGPTPASRPKWMMSPDGQRIDLLPDAVSEPVDYQMAGAGAPTVEGRQFEVGEHVEAAANPDPALFTEI